MWFWLETKQFLADFDHMNLITKVKSKGCINVGQIEPSACTHRSDICMHSTEFYVRVWWETSGCFSRSTTPEWRVLTKYELQGIKNQAQPFYKQTSRSLYVCGVIVTSCGQLWLVPSTDRLFLPVPCVRTCWEKGWRQSLRGKIPSFLNRDVRFQRGGKSYDTIAL